MDSNNKFIVIVRACLGFGLKTIISFVLIALSGVPCLMLIIYERLFKTKTYDSKYGGVLLGIQEVASNLHSIQTCLSQNGIQTTSIIRSNNFNDKDQFELIQHKNKRIYLNNKSISKFNNYVLYPVIKAFYFFKYFLFHQVIYIVWNDTFLPFGIDLLVGKYSKKKIILMHCGDDVRYRPLQREIDSKHGFMSWKEDKPSFKVFITHFYYTKLSEWSGRVISLRNLSTFQGKPYIFFNFPMPSEICTPKLSGKRIKIVHAPSSRYVKGTAIVLEAIEKLRSLNVNFEFILFEGQSNATVLSELKTTDILIDQPGDWVGRLAVEGCAAGCCVIGGNYGDYNNRNDSPVLQFERDANKLAVMLNTLLSDRKFLEQKMKECFEFWSNNYSPEAFYKFYLAVLTDQAPTFKPFPNQKQVLLAAASNWAEKIIILLFYHPKR